MRVRAHDFGSMYVGVYMNMYLYVHGICVRMPVCMSKNIWVVCAWVCHACVSMQCVLIGSVASWNETRTLSAVDRPARGWRGLEGIMGQPLCLVRDGC